MSESTDIFAPARDIIITRLEDWILASWEDPKLKTYWKKLRKTDYTEWKLTRYTVAAIKAKR